MLTIVSRELFENAVRLHGHLGPFLVLGLKMSLRARKILGRKPSGCEIATISGKPYLCAVDGIKAVIGNAVTVKEDDVCRPNLALLKERKSYSELREV
jgi:formylmethanofuran dehydrogenase subunit E